MVRGTAPTVAQQDRMLRLLREKRLVLAGHDQRVLNWLGSRRLARALPLHDLRGNLSMACAWQITDAGVAQVLRVASPARGRRAPGPELAQTDIEDAILASSSGGRPDAAPLPDLDASPHARADVSASKAALSKRALAAAKPETVEP